MERFRESMSRPIRASPSPLASACFRQVDSREQVLADYGESMAHKNKVCGDGSPEQYADSGP